MKPFSAITIIKESKVLFLFAVLSIITHTSIFLINPTFSFTISDKWEGSKGRFLSVELRKGGGKVSERAKSSEVQKSSENRRFRGSEVKKLKEWGAEKGKDKKVASAGNVRSKSGVSSKANLREDKNLGGKPVPKAVQPVEADRVESSAEPTTSLIQPSSGQSSPALSSIEREVGPADNKSDTSEDTEATSVQLSVTSEGHPEASPIERKVAQESEAILLVENAVDQPAIVAIKEEAEKDEVAQTSEPHPHPDPLPDGEGNVSAKSVFPDENEIEVKEPKRKEEGQSGVMVSEGRTGENFEDVKKAETEKGEQPVSIESSQPKLPEIEHSREMKVAEKEKEPAKVVEQSVEPPAKKKKRTIPFHKMLEPEKDATIGIPIGRPVVKITAPSKKKVNSRVQGISGRAQGNGVSRVTLSTNGGNAVIPVQNGRFLWDTVLREGKNTISASVWDMEGYSATDSITVQVLPPKNSFELSIDEPTGELESPVAIVRGRVEDATVDTVKLIVNGEFVETPVDDGYFEKTVFLKERENTLEAEAVNSAGLITRTKVLKVEVKNPMAPDILLHLLCDDHDIESHPKVTLRERSQLDDEKGAVSDADVIEMVSVNEGYWEKVFAVEEAKDGAYTLKVSEGKGTDCKLVVTLNSSKRKVRVFEKRLLEGEEWPVGRFLFPEGVFWDEDEWFSGRLEDKDSITKYKSSEGVTWKELKGE